MCCMLEGWSGFEGYGAVEATAATAVLRDSVLPSDWIEGSSAAYWIAVRKYLWTSELEALSCFGPYWAFGPWGV